MKYVDFRSQFTETNVTAPIMRIGPLRCSNIYPKIGRMQQATTYSTMGKNVANSRISFSPLILNHSTLARVTLLFFYNTIIWVESLISPAACAGRKFAVSLFVAMSAAISCGATYFILQIYPSGSKDS
jgi:hypothetical protein